jgi:hypothetical protein
MITTTYPKHTARKPHGGFVFLTVQQLCLLWWVYRTRRIRLMDFRVWFAAHEMVARRCQINAGQLPDYTPRELHGLVGGVGGEHLRASLRRLDALGLLIWSSTKLTFATAPTDLRGVEDLADFFTMHQAIVNNRRRVPVPRQAVRLIAGGLKASVIATMLGHLLRCLYYREQRCVSGGWCKASWIAEVFGMDLRSVKAARKHLVAIGWLQTFPAPPRLCNRWGNYTRISLSWTRETLEHAAENSAASPASASPPPAAFCTSKLPPLVKEHQEPLQELEHQEPAPLADAAPATTPLPFAAPTPRETTGVKPQDTDQTTIPTLPPTLHHIVPEDLRDTPRLLALFAQAQQHGLIGPSDSARLTFLATAEHARVMGSTNPCGLFAALIRRQLWHYVTDSDEDAASARLKQHWYGREGPRQPAPPPLSAEPCALSKDAFMVRELHRELARAGFQGDAFGWVHRAYPEWTRARWDHAVAELATAQQGWQRVNARNGLCDGTGVGDDLGSLAVSTADWTEMR